MRWVRRGLWIAAWGVWAWCGFGLYRELPRNLGTPRCQIPLPKSMAVPFFLGFVGDADHLALINYANDRRSSTVDVHETRTGARVRSTPGPRPGWYLSHTAVDGFVFAGEAPAPAGPAPGLYVLSLAGGDWEKLSEHRPSLATFCLRKGWVAFLDGRTSDPGGSRAIVFDYRRRREEFRRPETPGRLPDGIIQLTEDGRRLLVPTVSGPDGKERALEVWRIDGTPALERTFAGLFIGLIPFASHGSLIAFSEKPPGRTLVVYDLDGGEYVLTEPPRAAGGLPQKEVQRPPDPVFGPEGQTVLGGDPTALWNVQSHDALWRPQSGERPFAWDGQLFVPERWGEILNRWLPSGPYETTAIRSMTNGRLISRLNVEAGYVPTFWNASHAVGAAIDGRVHDSQVFVNWRLFALCQTLLALPLILLWLALRWHRKRRERRLAGATAS